SFGWDWGPDLQTAGIWKPVRIERWRVARLASVRPLITVEDGTGVATVHVVVERADADAPLTVLAHVAGHQAEVTIPAGATEASARVEVPNPTLWWPHGYGEAHLYDLTVELGAGEQVLDS